MNLKYLFLLLLFLGNTFFLNAQCAMCKAVVESNIENGGTKGAGLNDGILYLMAMPYIAMILFAIGYYFHNRTKNASTEAL